MKSIKLLTLILAGVILGAAAGVSFAAGSHPVKGYLLPTATNYTPATYKMWISTDATKTNSGACSYSNILTKTQYSDNIGNWFNGWSNGQVLISAVEKADATEVGSGLFGVSTLTLSDSTPSQNFADMAALAAIPKPTATANAAQGRVDLSWSAASAPAGTIAGYNVYRSTDGTTYTKINASLVSGTTYNDTTGVVTTNYTYAVRIVFTGGVETANRSQKSAQVTYPAVPVTPTLSSATPNSAYRGDTVASVAIVGSNTNFGASSVISFGSNIIVGGKTDNNTTHVAATTVGINVAAATGLRSVSVTTGAETASGSIFTINAPTMTMAPTTGNQGWSAVATTLSGTGSHFTNGVTTVAISGTGVTIVPSSTVINSATEIKLQLNIDAAAAQGARTITVTTNLGALGTETLTTTFTVAPSNTPALTSVTPNNGTQGQTLSSVAIVGVNTHFIAGTTVDLGTGITHGAITVTDPTHLSIANVAIAASAATGAHSVSVTSGGENVSGNLFTVNASIPVTVASLASATPNTGAQGQTLASVAIVGSNTNFTNASVVNFGADITSGTISTVDATHITISNVVIAATATAGLRSVKVTTGTEVASGDVFTVTTAAPTSTATSLVIDDYEGALASSYYQFGPTDPSKPTTAVITTDKYEGAKSMQTTYPSVIDGWRGWGATLTSTIDISAMNDISFYMKGDGSSNKVKLQVKDADGTNFAMADADAVALTSTSWQKYTLSSFKSKMVRVAGSTAGDAILDWSKVTEYQFVFTGSTPTNAGGVLIDYIVAAKAAAPAIDPVISSVTPDNAAPGTQIVVAGSLLGYGGSISFNDGFTDVYTISSSGTGEVTTQWIDSSVTFNLPKALLPGKKSIKIVRADGKTSNSILFTVLAPTVEATGTSYNYPNPFNALAGGTTKIVFATNGATAATAYIFDTTARVVAKLNWTGTGANGEISWDGKNSLSEILGDGAYIYRVVDASNKVLGKGKILVVNK